MAFKLFGFDITRGTEPESKPEDLQTFSAPVEDDGAAIVAGGSVGQYYDMDGVAKTDTDLINKYRQMSIHPQIDMALEEVVNEAIVDEPEEPIVKLSLEKTPLTANIKKHIQDEFDTILELLDMHIGGHDVFRQWYVDGRLFYQAVIDVKQPYLGIQEMRLIDPRKIRKIREVKRKKISAEFQGATTQTIVDEYFVFSETGFGAKAPGSINDQSVSLKISKDAIVYVPSGLLDPSGQFVISHLHKAIKPLNQLTTLEDATVIYRLVRAPERRVFYVDVGNLPKAKAEQYLKDMMIRHKNKIVYDSSNGEVRDERKFMTMLEDYWLPRREGSKGTEIDTLDGGQNLGEMTDVEYFQKKLYNALGVPTQRLDSANMFATGRPGEVSREEVKFFRFIQRLRTRFNDLFTQALGKQLVLKKILTQDEWMTISPLIKYEYAKDSYFSELKDLEIVTQRMTVLTTVDSLAGKYFSHKWVREKILQQTEEEIEQMDAEIEEEMKDPKYQDTEGPEDTSLGVDGGSGTGTGDDGQTQQILDAITKHVAATGFDRTEVSDFVRKTFGLGYTDAYYYVDMFNQGEEK